jgi:hypothetical protein
MTDSACCGELSIEGKLVLDHQYKAENEFWYRFVMVHPVFGELYQQEGSFKEMDGSEVAKLNLSFNTNLE